MLPNRTETLATQANSLILIECRKTKTKTKEIANTDHKEHRQISEPIKTWNKNMKSMQSAGKIVQMS